MTVMREAVLVEDEHMKVHVKVTFFSKTSFNQNYKLTQIHYIYFKENWIKIVHMQRIYKVREGENIIYHFIIYDEDDTMFHLIYNPLMHFWKVLSYEYET